MPDELDAIQLRIDADREAAVADRVQYHGESARVCADCQSPIPEARRRTIPGVQLCVDCQSMAEQGP